MTTKFTKPETFFGMSFDELMQLIEKIESDRLVSPNERISDEGESFLEFSLKGQEKLLNSYKDQLAQYAKK